MCGVLVDSTLEKSGVRTPLFRAATPPSSSSSLSEQDFAPPSCVKGVLHFQRSAVVKLEHPSTLVATSDAGTISEGISDDVAVLEDPSAAVAKTDGVASSEVSSEDVAVAPGPRASPPSLTVAELKPPVGAGGASDDEAFNVTSSKSFLGDDLNVPVEQHTAQPVASAGDSDQPPEPAAPRPRASPPRPAVAELDHTDGPSGTPDCGKVISSKSVLGVDLSVTLGQDAALPVASASGSPPTPAPALEQYRAMLSLRSPRPAARPPAPQQAETTTAAPEQAAPEMLAGTGPLAEAEEDVMMEAISPRSPVFRWLDGSAVPVSPTVSEFWRQAAPTPEPAPVVTPALKRSRYSGQQPAVRRPSPPSAVSNRSTELL